MPQYKRAPKSNSFLLNLQSSWDHGNTSLCSANILKICLIDSGVKGSPQPQFLSILHRAQSPRILQSCPFWLEGKHKEATNKAGHCGVQLLSQPSGGRGREISMSSRTARAMWTDSVLAPPLKENKQQQQK